MTDEFRKYAGREALCFSPSDETDWFAPSIGAEHAMQQVGAIITSGLGQRPNLDPEMLAKQVERENQYQAEMERQQAAAQAAESRRRDGEIRAGALHPSSARNPGAPASDVVAEAETFAAFLRGPAVN